MLCISASLIGKGQGFDFIKAHVEKPNESRSVYLLDSIRLLSQNQTASSLAQLEEKIKNIQSTDSIKGYLLKGTPRKFDASKANLGRVALGPVEVKYDTTLVNSQIALNQISDPSTANVVSKLEQHNELVDSIKIKELGGKQARRLLPQEIELISDSSFSNSVTDSTAITGHLNEQLKNFPVRLNDMDSIKNIDSAAVSIFEQKAMATLGKKTELGNPDDIKRSMMSTSDVEFDDLPQLNSQQAVKDVATENVQEFKMDLSDQQILDVVKEKSSVIDNTLITANAKKIQEQMLTLRKLKRKYSSIDDTRKLPKENVGKVKKDWTDCIGPGLSFWSMKGAHTWVNIEPHISFLASSRINFGQGFVYSVCVTPKTFSKKSIIGLTGVKIFSNINVAKGFSIRAELQEIRWNPTLTNQKNYDPKVKFSTQVLLTGIEKKYKVFHNVNGNVQLLYNKSLSERSPYNPKFLVRFGMEMSLRKDSKEPWQIKDKEAKKFLRKLRSRARFK